MCIIKLNLKNVKKCSIYIYREYRNAQTLSLGCGRKKKLVRRIGLMAVLNLNQH